MSAEDTLFQRFGKEFARGTVLFSEGEPGKEMYVLQTGRVTISKQVRDVEKVLAVLGPGEFFGEMAIISNKPRNASATVAEDAKLLVIDPKTFEGMIRGNSEIAVRLIKKLAERLSEADAQIENLLHSDPSSRIVHHVLSMAQSRGRALEEGVEHFAAGRTVAAAACFEQVLARWPGDAPSLRYLAEIRARPIS